MQNGQRVSLRDLSDERYSFVQNSDDLEHFLESERAFIEAAGFDIDEITGMVFDGSSGDVNELYVTTNPEYYDLSASYYYVDTDPSKLQEPQGVDTYFHDVDTFWSALNDKLSGSDISFLDIEADATGDNVIITGRVGSTDWSTWATDVLGDDEEDPENYDEYLENYIIEGTNDMFTDANDLKQWLINSKVFALAKIGKVVLDEPSIDYDGHSGTADYTSFFSIELLPLDDDSSGKSIRQARSNRKSNSFKSSNDLKDIQNIVNQVTKRFEGVLKTEPIVQQYDMSDDSQYQVILIYGSDEDSDAFENTHAVSRALQNAGYETFVNDAEDVTDENGEEWEFVIDVTVNNSSGKSIRQTSQSRKSGDGSYDTKAIRARVLARRKLGTNKTVKTAKAMKAAPFVDDILIIQEGIPVINEMKKLVQFLGGVDTVKIGKYTTGIHLTRNVINAFAKKEAGNPYADNRSEATRLLLEIAENLPSGIRGVLVTTAI